MRTFNGNLNAYHALNKIGDLKAEEFSRRMAKTTNLEELNEILAEFWKDMACQRESYRAQAEEMAKILRKQGRIDAIFNRFRCWMRGGNKI